MASKKSKRRKTFIPATCPKCGRAVRRFRRVSAVVQGVYRKRLDPAHFHVTFGGVCTGAHLHVCASCGTKIRTRDNGCGWREPKTLEPGWTAAKASQCDYDSAIEVPNDSERQDASKPSATTNGQSSGV